MKKIILHRVERIAGGVVDAGTEIAVGDPKKSTLEAPTVSAKKAKELISAGKAAAVAAAGDAESK